MSFLISRCTLRKLGLQEEIRRQDLLLGVGGSSVEVLPFVSPPSFLLLYGPVGASGLVVGVTESVDSHSNSFGGVTETRFRTTKEIIKRGFLLST